jgi:uncharacterized protein (DUF305 family)
MSSTALDGTTASAPPAPAGRNPLRTVLLLVIALGLVLLGGGAAVALGIGRGEDPPGAGSVDAGFAWDMSRHHLQGVQMANLVASRSSDPVIESLGFDISATQTNQVGRMQGWLSLWGLPQTNPNQPMAWMGGVPGSSDGSSGHDMSGMSGMAGMSGMPGSATASSGSSAVLMPGMATDEELARLSSLSGTAFDVEFLRLMIRHHQGGQEMAQYAAANAQVPAVRELARSIAETQAAEISTMVQLLTARGGTPLPPPA